MGELGARLAALGPVVQRGATAGSCLVCSCHHRCRHYALQLLTHLEQQIGWQVSVQQRPVPYKVSSSRAGMPRADCRFLPSFPADHAPRRVQVLLPVCVLHL